MGGLPLLRISGMSKGFTMHLQGALRLPVVSHVAFEVAAGECVVLGGPSGAGKSSILKSVYGNYLSDCGEILIRHDGEMVDIARLAPRGMLEVRRRSVGYVSQFLSVIPRVTAIDLVTQEGVKWFQDREQAEARAAELLTRLNVPERLWNLPPATFSGGEQQRVNIALGFIGRHPLLLLDEPTASLDAKNAGVVRDLIAERKALGHGLLGIFHDPAMRDAVADRIVDVTSFAAVA
ncbi:MAG: phosphonate C-P lyase system protein PhnL [Hyphomicrobiaceae bacterium]|nr:phosphonate C-P lyase system protein PhnL [Hyphomicrobiaceae bacterium]